ncbi:MAG TPA: phosphoribosylformylglycinamidine synthase subunit PurS [Candidatus Saccharimonadales bacterium]|nr:phosphoribosylformylglycinamidine synthase subunit PurS [Candidatus Saccharimonadales bacterium]
MLVSLKPVVNDPQGLVVTDALHSLGYPEVGATRVGKFISLEVTGDDAEAARSRVDEMCQRLLCNGVIEEYRFELRQASPP